MSNKVEIVFIILHYLDYDTTCKCIESIIITQKESNYRIIVVDNASNNLSGEKLRKKYIQNNEIEIIFNKENLGFSKGNNIGCDYARTKYQPEFLFVINNDVVLITENIYKILKGRFSEKMFDIAGPSIWNTNKCINQNPCSVIKNLEELRKEKRKLIFQKYLCKYFFKLYLVIRDTKRKIKNNRRKKEGLQGAALIFSERYYNKYKKIFIEKSFMYGEENFLYYRKQKDNLVMRYFEEIKILHNESISTQKNFKDEKKKILFQINHMLKARLELEKLYKFGD